MSRKRYVLKASVNKELYQKVVNEQINTDESISQILVKKLNKSRW